METEMYPVPGVDKDMADLDKILLSLEQDTNRQLQQLEKENRQTAALESRVKSTEEKIRHLEQANTKLDEDTKAVHCQFRQNRDSVDSLKKHYSVLIEHQEALSQRYEALQTDWQEQQIDIDKALVHYEAIWHRYKRKYESMPMAVELRNHKQELDAIESKLNASNDDNTKLKDKLHTLQYTDSDETWKKCVVGIAKMKIQSYKVEKEIKQLNEENNRMMLTVKEEKEKQNSLMQEYNAKKKLQEERANLLKIAQQQVDRQQQQMESSQQQRHQQKQQQQMEHAQQQQIKRAQQQQMEHAQQQQIDRAQQQQIERAQKQQMERAQQQQMERAQQQQMERAQQQQMERAQQQQIDRAQQMERAQQQQMERAQQQQIDRAQQQQIDRAQQQQMERAQQQQMERAQQQQMERAQQQQMERSQQQQHQQNNQERQQQMDQAKVMVSAEAAQVQNITIPQNLSVPQIPMIQTPVTPSRQVPAHSIPQLAAVPRPDLMRQADKNQPLKIPQLEISSPFLLGTPTRNLQPRVTATTTAAPPQLVCPTNLIQYRPRESLRIPSQNITTHRAIPQNEKPTQEVPASGSIYFQMPTLFQPPSSPCVDGVQTPRMTSGTQVQTPTQPSRPEYSSHQSNQDALQGSNLHIPTQDSTQHESSVVVPAVNNRGVGTSKQLQSSPMQLQTPENHSTITQEFPEVVEGNRSETGSNICQHTLEATSKVIPEVNDSQSTPAASQSIAGDSRGTSQVTSATNNASSTYEVMVPEDGRSLFESHKASFERNAGSSPGFEFKRRPMFDTMQGSEQKANQEQNTGEPASEDNLFFQSFFHQVGVDESRELSATSHPPGPGHSQLAPTSIGQSLFASPEGMPSSTMSGIFGESRQPSTFQSATSLFGGGDESATGQDGGHQTAGFLFAFGGEQDTDGQSPGFSFMGTASPNDAATTESGFSLF